MDKKKANNQLCAIVRPCGGVIEFIDTNRTAGDVFDSPSEDIRASCSFVVFDSELALAKNPNKFGDAGEGDDFNMECILEMAPAHCHKCTGNCPDLNKYNQEFIKEIYPLLLEPKESSHRENIFGDANFNDGFKPRTKRPN